MEEIIDLIEVGEYVRTKSGFIGKVIGRHGGYGLHYELDVDKEIQENFMNGIVHEDNIANHSKNIIDLIEIGDYVNGREVKHIAMFEGFPDYPKLIFVDEKHLIPGDTCKNDEIRTILTHEQFEQNLYKV